MYCSNCGTKNQDNAQHCVKCGYKLIHNAVPEKDTEEISFRKEVDWKIVLPAIPILIILLRLTEYLNNLEYSLALFIIATIIVLTVVGYFSNNIQPKGLNGVIVGATSFVIMTFLFTEVSLDKLVFFFLFGSVAGSTFGSLGSIIHKWQNKIFT